MIKNPNAFRNYDIEEKLEAGIKLVGLEVKSLACSSASLKDAYVIIKKGEAFLINMHIADYDKKGYVEYDPKRTRKLLLNKREILKLDAKVKEKGYSIIPICVYLSNGKYKVEIGLGKGKKAYDKRQDLLKKDQNLEIKRAMKLKNR